MHWGVFTLKQDIYSGRNIIFNLCCALALHLHLALFTLSKQLLPSTSVPTSSILLSKQCNPSTSVPTSSMLLSSIHCDYLTCTTVSQEHIKVSFIVNNHKCSRQTEEPTFSLSLTRRVLSIEDNI